MEPLGLTAVGAGATAVAAPAAPAPNCRIGRADGRSPGRTSCGFWRRSIAPPARHRRHPAPRRSVFLDPETIGADCAPLVLSVTGADQARAETRIAQSIDAELAQAKTGECTADASVGTCRGHHRSSKKSGQPCWVCRWRHPTAKMHHGSMRRRAAPTPGLTAGACSA